jgi:hypothetical protein
MPNDEHQKVTALGAFERPHLVPSRNRGDRYDDPVEIASDARCLRNHGCCHFPFATFAMASICSLGNFLIAWQPPTIRFSVSSPDRAGSWFQRR